VGGRPKTEPGAAASYPRVWIQDENRWGCGEPDEHGIYSWYEDAEHTLPSLIFEQWPLIESDLHQIYGIDTGSGVLADRSWKWLQTRIMGLLTCECRLQRKLAPPEKPKDPSVPHAPRR
jgi:hypothetical protein